MANKSSIGWTQSTWNPVTGCTKVSPGCAHCYAERGCERLRKMGSKRYANGFRVTLHPEILTLPLKWKSKRLIFVNSMSDLFHESISPEFLFAAFDTMRKANWHEFQILTKRPEILSWYSKCDFWPPNVWMGVSVELDNYVWRIEYLRACGAKTKFVSFEPLLGKVDHLDLTGIDWVIVGGESGPNCRPMDIDWARNIRDQCEEQHVPFFMKQLGGYPSKRSEPIEWPQDLRIQQYPGDAVKS